MNVLARRRWLNLGLLGLAVGLASLALFEPDRRQPASAPPLLEVGAARIERIRVERSGQESLAFIRRDDRWWMVAPGLGPANPVLIETILRLTEARCPRRYAVAEVDLRRLRLDPPHLRLWLNEREIRFGDTEPMEGRRYLRVGATVVLCADDVYPLLTGTAGSFLTPSIESLAPAPASDK